MAKKGSCSFLILFFAVLFLCLCKCQGFDQNLARKPLKGRKYAGFFDLHKGNLHVNLTNWGATLVSVKTPDKNGHIADILLGYDSLASYMKMSPSRPYMGAIMGRVANRIKNAQFTLDGKTYHLYANDGNNSLHGGRRGFDDALWDVVEKKGGSNPSIKFVYHSFDGEQGHLADIVQGYDSLAPYMNMTSRPHFGAIVGRVANRIKNAQFTLDGKTYHLFANDGNNSIHGGKRGFDNVLWEVKEMKGGSKPSIKFVYHSFDGEEGFPGALDVYAKYSISNDMELRLDMEAIPRNKASPVSLINHAYWNLAGQDSGRDILDNSVKVWASHYTPSDKALIPTGQILPVKGTPLDLRKETVIKSRINKVPSNEVPPGFDHNYVLDGPKTMKGLRIAARAKDPWSSRVLEVWTNAPGLQFYTSNNLKDTEGKGGVIYKPHSSFCFESQAFPDAVNQPNFPSVIVHPGEVYKHTMLIKFSVDV